jgi:hypothetical protein
MLRKFVKMNDEKEKDDSATEILDFSKPDFEFRPKEYHEWRQRGPYLVCTSCEIEHATYIGMEKIMVGLNDKGQPILKKR